MKLRAKKGEGAATLEEFAEYAEGVICLIPTSNIQHPTSDFDRLLDIFGPREVYAQVQRHFNREQEARNQAATQRPRPSKIPPLPTNLFQHARPHHREIPH